MLLAPNHFLITSMSSLDESIFCPLLLLISCNCLAIAFLPITKFILCNNLGLANSSSFDSSCLASLTKASMLIDSKPLLSKRSSAFDTLTKEFL